MKIPLNSNLKNQLFKPLGNRIKRYRKLRGLKQTDLARLVGIQALQIHHYENGNCELPLSKVFKISQVLEIPCAELLPEQLEVSSLPDDILALVSFIMSENINAIQVLNMIKVNRGEENGS